MSANESRITIDGQDYMAINLSGGTWMVRRFKLKNGIDDESGYEEQLLHMDTNDPQAVLQQAIKNGSWA